MGQLLPIQAREDISSKTESLKFCQTKCQKQMQEMYGRSEIPETYLFYCYLYCYTPDTEFLALFDVEKKTKKNVFMGLKTHLIGVFKGLELYSVPIQVPPGRPE